MIKFKIPFKISLFILLWNINGHATEREVLKESNSCGFPQKSNLYIAVESFETERLLLKKIDSALEEITLYQKIYEESGHPNSWFSCGPSILTYPKDISEAHRAQLEKESEEIIFDTDDELIQKKEIEYFYKKQHWGIYSFPMSFPDYIILSKETNQPIGRFLFKNIVRQGRIENGIYLFQEYRGKGLGIEVLKGIMKNVIDPAIGQSFVISYYPYLQEKWFSQEDLETITFQNFQGIYSHIAPWSNYPSLSASYKAGCDVSWHDMSIKTFYPKGNGSYMSEEHLEIFKEIIKDSYDFTQEIKKFDPSGNFNIPFIQFLRLFSSLPHKRGDNIINNFYKLLDTKDPETWKSVQKVRALLREEVEEESEEDDEEDFFALPKKRSRDEKEGEAGTSKKVKTAEQTS